MVLEDEKEEEARRNRRRVWELEGRPNRNDLRDKTRPKEMSAHLSPESQGWTTDELEEDSRSSHRLPTLDPLVDHQGPSRPKDTTLLEKSTALV